jgi:hypothetical protein
MKGELLESLDNRFRHLYTNKFYVVATSLDPRFKMRYFTDDASSELAKREIRAAVPNADDDETTADTAMDTTNLPQTSQEKSTDYWDWFDEAASAIATSSTQQEPSTVENLSSGSN